MAIPDPVRNFARVEASTGYNSASTSVILIGSDGAKLPAPSTEGAFNLTWWNRTQFSNPTDDPNREIVRVTARATDTLTIERAQEGTVATDKNDVGDTYNMHLGPTRRFVENLLPPNYISGIELTFDSTSQVSLSTGYCTDSTNKLDINVESTITANITISGAGGLDTGTEAIDTWYAVHVIDDSTGVNTPNAILSISDTAPTLPLGYDIFRRVGWVRNNNFSNFLKFYQRGYGLMRRIWLNKSISTTQVLNNGSATTFTAIDLSSLVPQTSDNIVLLVQFETGSAGAASDHIRLRPSNSSVGDPVFRVRTGLISTTKNATNLEMPCDNTQSIDYRVMNIANGVHISVAGWDDEL